MPLARGRVDRVEPPNEQGFVRIWVDVAGQEDQLRLDTNRQDKIRQAIEARDSHQWWEITYNENPVTKWNDRAGRNVTYPNRYWEDAILSAQQGGGYPQLSRSDFDEPTPPPGFNAPQAQSFDAPRAEREYGWKTNPEDAWRMALSTGAKLAIETLPMLPDNQRSFQFQKEVAIAWARFIFFTSPPTVNEIVPGVEQSLGSFRNPEPSAAFAGAATGASYDQPPSHGDDDIPF